EFRYSDFRYSDTSIQGVKESEKVSDGAYTKRRGAVKKAEWQRILAGWFFVAGKGRVLQFGHSIRLHHAQLFKEFFSLTGGFGGLACLLSHVALAFDIRALE